MLEISLQIDRNCPTMTDPIHRICRIPGNNTINQFCTSTNNHRSAICFKCTGSIHFIFTNETTNELNRIQSIIIIFPNKYSTAITVIPTASNGIGVNNTICEYRSSILDINTCPIRSVPRTRFCRRFIIYDSAIIKCRCSKASINGNTTPISYRAVFFNRTVFKNGFTIINIDRSTCPSK